MDDLKTLLHGELTTQRAALLFKLDGLSERDARWPRTPTGTNLLGLIKHCAVVELGYFGPVFGRRPPLPFPWEADGVSPEDNLDFFAVDGESMSDVLDYAHDCFRYADDTIEKSSIDALGEVPWWPPARQVVTLGQVIVHVALDEARHAGHADILREQIDGAVGYRDPGDNLPGWDTERWASYVENLRRIADGCPSDAPTE